MFRPWRICLFCEMLTAEKVDDTVLNSTSNQQPLAAALLPMRVRMYDERRFGVGVHTAGVESNRCAAAAAPLPPRRPRLKIL